MKYIDMHAHIWDDYLLRVNRTGICIEETQKEYNETENNIKTILTVLDNNPDIVKAGISPLFGGYYPNGTAIIDGNDTTLNYIQQYPERFFGYFTVNPNNTRNAVAEIKRAAQTDGIHGIKLWIACRADRKEIEPTIKACVDHDLPILIHAFYKRPSPEPEESTPDHIAILAKKFPQAKIIMAHVGMDWVHAVRVVADYKNIYTDFSGTIIEQGTIEKAVQYMGSERVLWGTDLPYAPAAANIGMLKGARISQSDKQKIAFDNANNLLKLNLDTSKRSSHSHADNKSHNRKILEKV